MKTLLYVSTTKVAVVFVHTKRKIKNSESAFRRLVLRKYVDYIVNAVSELLRKYVDYIANAVFEFVRYSKVFRLPQNINDE